MHAFNSLPWYLLPLHTQKDIRYILNRTQYGPILTIGPFAELNYETATKVCSNEFSCDIQYIYCLSSLF